MELKTPQTWQFGHPNFGTAKTEVSVNDGQSDEATLYLNVKAPDGRFGQAHIQMQDNGNVVLRIHMNNANPIHVLIVNDSGLQYEA